MQRSGFFNALLNNGVYDRKYNANDYSDNLAVVISNGVLRSENDDLRATAAGMVVTVGTGRAWIEGHYFINDTPHAFSAIAAPVGGARYDRIILRLDKSLAVRSVSLVYQQGEASNNPTKPAPVREGDIYDIVLADVYVTAGATSVIVTDTRSNKDVCGWVYSTAGDNSFFESLDAAFREWFEEKKDTLSSVTLFKRYNWRTVLATATNKIPFSIPQYNAETCFLEVFVNGALVTDGADYTAAASVLTFTNTLIAGTEIEVKCYKSIDSTGIESVADEITALQNAVAALNTTGQYDYVCNGVDDNVKLSEIAQAWLNGGTDDKTTIIKVYGNFVANAPFAGTGTEASGFQWLSLGLKETARRKIIFDFSAVEQMYFNCSGNTKNIIFYGADVHIKGAHVKAAGSEANTNVIMFSGRVGEINVEDCDLTISTTGTATIAESGTFVNCKTWIASTGNTAASFAPVSASRPLVVFGGSHYAYCGGNGNFATVFYTAPAATNAVLMAYGVTLPKVDRAALIQTYGALTDAGKVYISGITTTLGLTKGANCEVYGHIAINKA
jgi:hypothetical protein